MMRNRYVALTIVLILMLLILYGLSFIIHTGGSALWIHWSPDQSRIVYLWWDNIGLWMFVPDGGSFLHQKRMLYWCSVDQLAQQESIELDSQGYTKQTLAAELPVFFSPDSSQIAVVKQKNVRIVDLPSGKAHDLASSQWPSQGWLSPGSPVSKGSQDSNADELTGNEIPLGYSGGLFHRMVSARRSWIMIRTSSF
jgi:hypothetical protein